MGQKFSHLYLSAPKISLVMSSGVFGVVISIVFSKFLNPFHWILIIDVAFMLLGQLLIVNLSSIVETHIEDIKNPPKGIELTIDERNTGTKNLLWSKWYLTLFGFLFILIAPMLSLYLFPREKKVEFSKAKYKSSIKFERGNTNVIFQKPNESNYFLFKWSDTTKALIDNIQLITDLPKDTNDQYCWNIPIDVGNESYSKYFLVTINKNYFSLSSSNTILEDFCKPAPIDTIFYSRINKVIIIKWQSQLQPDIQYNKVTVTNIVTNDTLQNIILPVNKDNLNLGNISNCQLLVKFQTFDMVDNFSEKNFKINIK